MGVRSCFEAQMKARYGGRYYWEWAPEETKRRWRAYWWCLGEMRDRSWFYKDGEIPAWVPEAVMYPRAVE